MNVAAQVAVNTAIAASRRGSQSGGDCPLWVAILLGGIVLICIGLFVWVGVRL